MLPPPTEAMLAALARVPELPCLITTAHGEIRDGRMIERVQQCGTQPPMMLVAMEKGHPLSPLIRDSRTFGLSLLDPNERLIQRIFGPDRRIGEDPFLTYKHHVGRMGAPIVTRATAWFDCEVVRHFDMETNYELYVGLVLDGAIGELPVQRLSAALTVTRPGGVRAPRVRAPDDHRSAAESPVERARAVPPVAKPAPALPRRARGR